MFLVTCVSPLDEVWEERDELMRRSVGRKSDVSGASGGDGDTEPFRDHVWYAPVFSEALQIKKCLDLVAKTRTTIREHSTYEITTGPIN